jgi:DNA-binding CsgD family transcriptional regulator
MADLTPRETETLKWLVEGKTLQQMGEVMGIARSTADKHMRGLREKLGVRTRHELVVAAFRRKLVE